MTTILALLFLVLGLRLLWCGHPLSKMLLLLGPLAVIIAFRELPASSAISLLFALAALLLPLAIRDIRRPWIVRRRLQKFQSQVQTGQALPAEASPSLTLWWDADLVGGMPRWDRFDALPPPVPTRPEGTDELVRRLAESVQARTTGESQVTSPLIPSAFGGRGLTRLEVADAVFQLAEILTGGGADALALTPLLSVGPAPLLCQLGTPEQQKRYLPSLASGKLGSVLLLPDPDDEAYIETVSGNAVVVRAEVDGELAIGLRVDLKARAHTLDSAERSLAVVFVNLTDPDDLMAGIDAPGNPICLLLELDTLKNQSGIDTELDFLPLDQMLGFETECSQLPDVLSVALSVHQALMLSPLRANGLHSADRAPTEGAAAVLAFRFTAHALDLGECPALACRLAGLALQPRDSTASALLQAPLARLPSATLSTDNYATAGHLDIARDLTIADSVIAQRLQALRIDDYHRSLAIFDDSNCAKWRQRFQLSLRSLLSGTVHHLIGIFEDGQAAAFRSQVSQRAARAALIRNLCFSRYPVRQPHPALSAQLALATAQLYLLSASLWRMPGDLPAAIDAAMMDRLRGKACEDCDQALARATAFIEPPARRWLIKLLTLSFGTARRTRPGAD